MDTLFPLGFAGPTTLYLVLYVATMALHVVLMNYVVAGSGYLMWAGAFTGGSAVQRHRSPLALALRDWLTVAVSAAITAGIAPLLFVQILYKERFYSANLLLSGRWMMILPALIVGFYLLYLYKSRVITAWPTWLRVAVGFTALACFLFTGYTWTENHLLSMAQDQWPDFYAQGRLFWWTPELLPRLMLWFTGAVPTMAMLGGWQVWRAQRQGAQAAAIRDDKPRLVALGLGGLLASAVTALAYFSLLPEATLEVITGPLAAAWLGLALLGGLVQATGWALQWRKEGLSGPVMGLISAGSLMSVLGMTVVREAIRLSHVDIVALAPKHAETAQNAGMWAFLIFLVINVGLIGWVVRTASAGRAQAQEEAAALVR